MCLIALVLMGLMGLTVPTLAAEVRLSWRAPTTNADGSPLRDLASYQVYAAVDGDPEWTPMLTDKLARHKPATHVRIGGLLEGTMYWFTVTAIDTSGNASEEAPAVSYTVPMQ